MTALAAPQAPTQAPNRAPRARRRLRPAAILAASLVVVAGSYALSIGFGPRAGHAVAPALQPLAPAGPVAQQPIQAAGGPIAGSSDSVAKIDHAISDWTAIHARNSKVFLSGT
jgi:hypothetical protein